MTPLILDLGFLVVVLLSTAIGIGRGFVRSLFSLFSWIVAGWLTFQFGDSVSDIIGGFGFTGSLQQPAAYVGLFFLILLIASIASTLASNMIISSSFVSIDRTLGAAFGIVRGVVIVGVLIILASLLVQTDAPWWQESLTVNWMEPHVDNFRAWLTDLLNESSVSMPASSGQQN